MPFRFRFNALLVAAFCFDKLLISDKNIIFHLRFIYLFILNFWGHIKGAKQDFGVIICILPIETP
jgi:hypothetical protein